MNEKKSRESCEAAMVAAIVKCPNLIYRKSGLENRQSNGQQWKQNGVELYISVIGVLVYLETDKRAHA